MLKAITKTNMLSTLRMGVARSSDLIALITDYHGGPITTEYMLTSDIARELIDQKYEVEVEYLNRKLVNNITRRSSGSPKPKFGSQRTDVVVIQHKFYPLAIIEVKIGVKSLRGIISDILKITKTINAMKDQFSAIVWGAAVFQIHVHGKSSRFTKDHLKEAI